MNTSEKDKIEIKKIIVTAISGNKEIEKIVIFGSFLQAGKPNDIDIAIFEDSKEDYLTLALKYRKQLRQLSKRVPVDVIPLKNEYYGHILIDEINNGEVIYEK